MKKRKPGPNAPMNESLGHPHRRGRSEENQIHPSPRKTGRHRRRRAKGDHEGANASTTAEPSTQFSDYELPFLIVVFLSSFPIARPFVERALGSLIPLATHWAGKMLSRTPKYQRRELVEEAVQNWQINLLGCALRVDPKRSIAKYAFGILLHCCYGEIRRAKRTSTRPLTSDVFDEAPGVEDGMSGSETRDMIEVALGDLPSHYRQILVEQYWEGLSAVESAEHHGKTVRAIDSLRFRAHAAMAIALVRRGYLR